MRDDTELAGLRCEKCDGEGVIGVDKRAGVRGVDTDTIGIGYFLSSASIGGAAGRARGGGWSLSLAESELLSYENGL